MNRPHSDNPRISSLCPNDLGLKAGYWASVKRDKINFRPIVGWVSITNYVAAQKPPFAAIVLNDHNEPTFASDSVFPNYIGNFASGISDAAALEAAKALTANRPNPPTTGVGRAVE